MRGNTFALMKFVWTLVASVAVSILVVASTEWLSGDRSPSLRLSARATIDTEYAGGRVLLKASSSKERCRGIFKVPAVPWEQTLEDVAQQGSSWRAWVINLDGAQERLGHFNQQVAASDIPRGELPVQRLAASNSSLLSLPSLLSPRAQQELQQAEQLGYRTAHYQLTWGSVGCYVSHVRAWQALLDSRAEMALVFEDDALLAPHFWAGFVGGGAPAGWDVILFSGTCLCCSKKPVVGTSYKKVSRFWGTQVYAISAKAAQKLVNRGLFPIEQQIDSLMSVMAAEGSLRVYFHGGKLANQSRGLGTSQNKVEGEDIWALPPQGSDQDSRQQTQQQQQAQQQQGSNSLYSYLI